MKIFGRSKIRTDASQDIKYILKMQYILKTEVYFLNYYIQNK